MPSKMRMIKFFKFYFATVSTWLLILFFVIVPFDFKFDGFDRYFLKVLSYVILYSSIPQALVFYFIEKKYAPGDRFVGFAQTMVFGFIYNFLTIIILIIRPFRPDWITYLVAPLIVLLIEFSILLGWPRFFKKFYPDHFINL